MSGNSAVVEPTPKTFASQLQGSGALGPDVSAAVRLAMEEMLGEISAVAAIAYAGDAGNGDFLGFAMRMEELYGNGSAKIFMKITEILFKDADASHREGRPAGKA